MLARCPPLIIACCLVCFSIATATAQIQTLVTESCISCHDESTDTGLNLDQLKFNLDDRKNFATWERIYDRIRTGEMPPPSENRPDASTQKKALAQIENALKIHSKKISTRKWQGIDPAADTN